jgi:hypothetical protein
MEWYTPSKSNTSIFCNARNRRWSSYMRQFHTLNSKRWLSIDIHRENKWKSYSKRFLHLSEPYGPFRRQCMVRLSTQTRNGSNCLTYIIRQAIYYFGRTTPPLSFMYLKIPFREWVMDDQNMANGQLLS